MIRPRVGVAQEKDRSRRPQPANVAYARVEQSGIYVRYGTHLESFKFFDIFASLSNLLGAKCHGCPALLRRVQHPVGGQQVQRVWRSPQILG
jgi:hypothetical protein